nr:MAG TPA: hypothetical protein [Caudoviricetes sp.]
MNKNNPHNSKRFRTFHPGSIPVRVTKTIHRTF